jgi:hypothetical protein
LALSIRFVSNRRCWLSQGEFRKQARVTTIWVTDDGRHLPVRIESAVYIGNVSADLVQVIGAAQTPTKAQSADAAKQRDRAGGSVTDGTEIN